MQPNAASSASSCRLNTSADSAEVVPIGYRCRIEGRSRDRAASAAECRENVVESGFWRRLLGHLSDSERFQTSRWVCVATARRSGTAGAEGCCQSRQSRSSSPNRRRVCRSGDRGLLQSGQDRACGVPSSRSTLDRRLALISYVTPRRRSPPIACAKRCLQSGRILFRRRHVRDALPLRKSEKLTADDYRNGTTRPSGRTTTWRPSTNSSTDCEVGPGAGNRTDWSTIPV